MPGIIVSKKLFDALSELTSNLDDRGREMLNDEPMEMPIGLNRPPTLQEQIKRLVKVRLSEEMAYQGRETFEEANDFDVDDDPFPSSQYEEMPEDPSFAPSEVHQAPAPGEPFQPAGSGVAAAQPSAASGPGDQSEEIARLQAKIDELQAQTPPPQE